MKQELYINHQLKIYLYLITNSLLFDTLPYTYDYSHYFILIWSTRSLNQLAWPAFRYGLCLFAIICYKNLQNYNNQYYILLLSNYMDQEGHNISLSNSSGSRAKQRQLFALIGEDSLEMRPYRSKFQMKSIGSGSRASRDSDLLNRLCQDQSKSSKSLSRNVSNTQLNHKSLMNSSSNSILSDRGSNGMKNESKNESGSSVDIKNDNKMAEVKQAPKIHNCVCFVAGQCLNYNCNCFLSPFPCAPECCPNCLTLKSGLPHKISNMCSCKKTKCLKLYCECLSKGQFCSVMCRCELCENHEHSKNRLNSLNNLTMFSGCSCSKSRCVKKYCECYAQGIKCTRKCICIGCKNFIQEKQENPKSNENHKVQHNANLMKPEPQQMDIEFEEVDFYSGRRLG